MDFIQALMERAKAKHLALGGFSSPISSIGSGSGRPGWENLGSADWGTSNLDPNNITKSFTNPLMEDPRNGQSSMDKMDYLDRAQAFFKNPGKNISNAWNTSKEGLGKSISDAWHQAIGAGGGPAFNPAVPTDTFHASLPEISRTNFEPGMMAGTAGYLEGMGGLNQAYNKQLGLGDMSLETLNAQRNLYGQQQGLADALLAQSRGEGPNPAQQQFMQNVNQNIRQQAGALASQRGINPALAGRMAAQMGAEANQNAAGQAALLQAQQQLAAQQQLGQNYGQMGQNLLGQGSTFNTAGNLYGGAGALANSMAGTGVGYYGQNVQGQGAQNNAITTGTLGTNQINAGVAAGNADRFMQGQKMLSDQAISRSSNNSAMNRGLLGGAMQGIGGLATQAGLGTAFGKLFKGGSGDTTDNTGDAAGNAGDAAGNAGDAASEASNIIPEYHGGQIPDKKALSLADALMQQGGKVPGKAKVKGDNPKNDTVPTVLSPNEIVLPRSVAMSDDAPQKAAEFVARLKGKKGVGPKGYGKILEKHRQLQQKMADLEAIIKRSAS